MTVTELREALQKLEAEGKGALKVAIPDSTTFLGNCHEEAMYCEIQPAKPVGISTLNTSEQVALIF